MSVLALCKGRRADLGYDEMDEAPLSRQECTKEEHWQVRLEAGPQGDLSIMWMVEIHLESVCWYLIRMRKCARIDRVVVGEALKRGPKR